MTNKDQELTKEELTALCKKQEEYIKELEEKLKTPSDTEKCEVAKPDYDELSRQAQRLDLKIFKLKRENEALRHSLTKMHMELNVSQSREEMWQENYYKESNRTDKLFEDLDELKRKIDEN